MRTVEFDLPNKIKEFQQIIHLLSMFGVQEVVGSNPASPTLNLRITVFSRFLGKNEVQKSRDF